MRFLRNANSPPSTQLVQTYIDSAYDNVALVAANMTAVLAVAASLSGPSAALTAEDIDTLAELNAIVGDATLGDSANFASAAQGATADSALQSAGINTLAKLNAIVADATLGNSSDFATSAQGTTADNALQPASINTLSKLNAIVADATLGNAADFATAAQGAKADTATQPSDNVSTLTNDANYADDQTDTEIETAYHARVAVVTQGDAEAGTATATKRWTAERVKQAIVALALQVVSKYLGQRLETGVTYTLVLADAGRMIEMNNAATQDLTVPPNSSVAFPVDTRIDIHQQGAGLLSIVAGGGVTIRTNGGLDSAGQYAGLSLWKRATDEWVLYGGVV